MECKLGMQLESNRQTNFLTSFDMIRQEGGENVDAAVAALANVKQLLQNVEAFDLKELTTMIGELSNEQRICAEAVEAYNNKVYIENVRDKKQSAGMARFAGAQGMASLLKNNDGTLLSQKQTFRAQNEAGQQQLQQFRDAYKMEQDKRQALGMDAVHRGAANKAKEKLQE